LGKSYTEVEEEDVPLHLVLVEEEVKKVVKHFISNERLKYET